MTPPTAVIDTADWRLAVPLKTALDLTGSRLTAAMTRDFGGAPAASVDSADGSITWTPDPATGLTSSIVITVPKARRGTWLASQALTLIFDVHRTVEGSDADEHLGRSSLYVMPASDSAFVAQRRGGANPILAAPYGSAVLLPALQTGPQGRPGVGGGSSAAVVVPQATPSASWAIPHPFGRLPSVTVYDASGSELIADISATPTMVSVVFAKPTAGSAVLS